MIILTGGCGFIGSNVLECLNKRGITDVTVVDEFDQTDKWKNLVGKSFSEVIDKSQIFDYLDDSVTAIIHLGACSSTVERDSNFLLENNYRYSKRLAQWAFERNVRFIYASSAATYGDGKRGFSDDHELLEQYEPLNMYGFSKHLFDLWLKKEGLLERAVGLKYFNVYGPNEYHKGRMASAILKMVPDVQQEGRIKLFASSEPQKFGDGDQVRDFIYVKDAAEMTVQFLENDLGGIFNVGTGIEQTWNQLAQGVIKGVDLGGKIEYISMPADLIGKYQNYTCAEMKKSHANKLYMPKFSLEDAVVDYVRNYVLQERYV
ncbi:MAG: ADP-L-glycero-D-manno-heptose-6-epimerase [Chlamydiales bacterium]|nr:ADP-L-glycero-D-manno-heptose-6-epimerase [Chlamydiales bacterium]MCH9635913.1 ADP-L-glycero-D-manno-heptose-6-epimerase [Chlamydiales bacterium]